MPPSRSMRNARSGTGPLPQPKAANGFRRGSPRHGHADPSDFSRPRHGLDRGRSCAAPDVPSARLPCRQRRPRGDARSAQFMTELAVHPNVCSTGCGKGPVPLLAFRIDRDGGIEYRHPHSHQASMASGSAHGSKTMHRSKSPTVRSSSSAALASEIAPSASARNVSRLNRVGSSPGKVQGSS